MSFGLETFDKDGNPGITVDSRLARWILSSSYSIGDQSSISISIPGIVNDGTWVVLCVPHRSNNVIWLPPVVSFGTDLITLSNPEYGSVSGLLLVFRV